VIAEEPIDPKVQRIYAVVPHGPFPFSLGVVS